MFHRHVITFTLVVIGTTVCTLDALAIDTGGLSAYRDSVGVGVSSGEGDAVVSALEDGGQKKKRTGSYDGNHFDNANEKKINANEVDDDKEEEDDDHEINNDQLIETGIPARRRPILTVDDDREDDGVDKKRLGLYDGNLLNTGNKGKFDSDEVDEDNSDENDEFFDEKLVDDRIPSRDTLNRRPILTHNDDKEEEENGVDKRRSDVKINTEEDEDDDDDDDDEIDEQLHSLWDLNESEIPPQGTLNGKPAIVNNNNKEEDDNEEKKRLDSSDGTHLDNLKESISENEVEDKDSTAEDFDDELNDKRLLVIDPQVLLIARPILIPLEIKIKYLRNLARGRGDNTLSNENNNGGNNNRVNR